LSSENGADGIHSTWLDRAQKPLSAVPCWEPHFKQVSISTHPSQSSWPQSSTNRVPSSTQLCSMCASTFDHRLHSIGGYSMPHYSMKALNIRLTLSGYHLRQARAIGRWRSLLCAGRHTNPQHSLANALVSRFWIRAPSRSLSEIIRQAAIQRIQNRKNGSNPTRPFAARLRPRGSSAKATSGSVDAISEILVASS